ncbi:4519_t:CDS:2, partial [Funneliformis mosseae]
MAINKDYKWTSSTYSKRTNGILQQKLEKWKEDTERNDWSFALSVSVVLSAPLAPLASSKSSKSLILLAPLALIASSVPLVSLAPSVQPVQSVPLALSAQLVQSILVVSSVLLVPSAQSAQSVLAVPVVKSTEYQIGDLVRVAIPKIDRFSIDNLIIPCRIMKKIEDKYQVRSKFKIIEVCYSAYELEPLRTTFFPELENIPFDKISIREALQLQSVRLISK